MPKISSYTTVKPAAGDLLVGTDIVGTPTDATRNFTAGTVAALAGQAGVLGLVGFDDNAAAVAAGLAADTLYKTTGAGASPLDVAGIVMVVV